MSRANLGMIAEQFTQQRSEAASGSEHRKRDNISSPYPFTLFALLEGTYRPTPLTIHLCGLPHCQID